VVGDASQGGAQDAHRIQAIAQGRERIEAVEATVKSKQHTKLSL
jgi:hypothetical protein